MRIVAAITVGLTAALVNSGYISQAIGQILTPFRYEAQAQRHCPDDAVVWLDFRREKYYSKGQRRYAEGMTGSFVCREEARSSRYRRSLLGRR
jgi:hypothetical protein